MKFLKIPKKQIKKYYKPVGCKNVLKDAFITSYIKLEKKLLSYSYENENQPSIVVMASFVMCTFWLVWVFFLFFFFFLWHIESAGMFFFFFCFFYSFIN